MNLMTIGAEASGLQTHFLGPTAISRVVHAGENALFSLMTIEAQVITRHSQQKNGIAVAMRVMARCTSELSFTAFHRQVGAPVVGQGNIDRMHFNIRTFFPCQTTFQVTFDTKGGICRFARSFLSGPSTGFMARTANTRFTCSQIIRVERIGRGGIETHVMRASQDRLLRLVALLTERALPVFRNEQRLFVCPAVHPVAGETAQFTPWAELGTFVNEISGRDETRKGSAHTVADLSREMRELSRLTAVTGHT